MTVTLIPDAEKVVSKYLREHPDVLVAAAGVRIVGKTPESHAAPWVRVTQLDASATGSTVDHLVEFLLQFDCYAGATDGQPQASLLARTARAALNDINGAEFDDTVISGCRVDSSARIPDTDFEPARERFIVTATIWAHTA